MAERFGGEMSMKIALLFGMLIYLIIIETCLVVCLGDQFSDLKKQIDDLKLYEAHMWTYQAEVWVGHIKAH